MGRTKNKNNNKQPCLSYQHLKEDLSDKYFVSWLLSHLHQCDTQLVGHDLDLQNEKKKEKKGEGGGAIKRGY